MQVRYIFNENGEKESVVIPYREWERIRIQLGETGDLKYEFNPTDYFGIYKDMNLNLEEEIENLRNEWSRLDI